MMSVIRFLLLLVHAVVVVLLLGTFANAYIPPKVFPLVNFLSLIFPIVFVIHCICTLLWVMMWRKRAFLFIFITIFCISPMQRWVNFTPTSKEKSDLKIISLNAHGGKEGADKINRFISEEKPDVFFIQEGLYISENLPIKGYEKTRISDFLHIYSKYPLVQSGVLYEEQEEVTECIYADMDFNGKTIRLINFYLEPFKLDMAEKQAKNIDESYLNKFAVVFRQHQHQAKVIHQAVKSSPYPVIVAGDMNAVPNSYEYYTISEGLSDSFQSSGMGVGTTFQETKMPIKIDYIFSSKNIKPLNTRVYKAEKISDHNPIIAEMQIK